jgi:pectin methylesterase-like acyl-CoA thioesterase
MQMNKFLISLVSSLAIITFFSCSVVKKSAEGRIIVVGPEGWRKCRTVQEAVDKVPDNNKGPITIFIENDTYQERVHIPKNKPFITLEGQDWRHTIITQSVPHNSADDSGVVRIDADNTTLQGLTIKNTHRLGSGAEMAVRVLSAKNLLIKDCALYGKQDTLFFYGKDSSCKILDCYIEGVNDGAAVEGTVLIERTWFYMTGRFAHAVWLYGRVALKNCCFDGEPGVRALRLASNGAEAYFVNNIYTGNAARMPLEFTYRGATVKYYEPEAKVYFPRPSVRLDSPPSLDF